MTVSTVSTVSTPGTVTRPSRSSWFPWRHPQHDHPALQAAHDDRTFGERVADHIASFGGSWPFIFIFLGMIVILDSGQHRPAPARHRPAPIRPLSPWAGAQFYFEKVRDRNVWDFPLLNVASA